MMYVDEAGDLASLGSPAGHNDQPIFILAGLIIESSRIRAFTAEYLAAKRRFFPGLTRSKHGWHLLKRQLHETVIPAKAGGA